MKIVRPSANSVGILQAAARQSNNFSTFALEHGEAGEKSRTS